MGIKIVYGATTIPMGIKIVYGTTAIAFCCGAIFSLGVPAEGTVAGYAATATTMVAVLGVAVARCLQSFDARLRALEGSDNPVRHHDEAPSQPE